MLFSHRKASRGRLVEALTTSILNTRKTKNSVLQIFQLHVSVQ